MTVDQQNQAIEYLAENGWTWTTDQLHPNTCGTVVFGWWLHPVHRPRPTGDSRKMHYAAQIAFELADYDMNELRPAWMAAYA